MQKGNNTANIPCGECKQWPHQEFLQYWESCRTNRGTSLSRAAGIWTPHAPQWTAPRGNIHPVIWGTASSKNQIKASRGAWTSGTSCTRFPGAVCQSATSKCSTLFGFVSSVWLNIFKGKRMSLNNDVMRITNKKTSTFMTQKIHI